MEKEFNQLKHYFSFNIHVVTFIFSKYIVIFYLFMIVWTLLNIRNKYEPDCSCSLDISFAFSFLSTNFILK